MAKNQGGNASSPWAADQQAAVASQKGGHSRPGPPLERPLLRLVLGTPERPSVVEPSDSTGGAIVLSLSRGVRLLQQRRDDAAIK